MAFPKKLEEAAAKNLPPPTLLYQAELTAYIQLRDLYASYRKGNISKAEAKVIKDRIENAMITARSTEVFLSREHLAMHQKIVLASKDYKANPTIENANKMYEAFWNERLIT